MSKHLMWQGLKISPWNQTPPLNCSMWLRTELNLGSLPKCSARNILPILTKSLPRTGCSRFGCSSAFFLRRGGLVTTYSWSNWNLWTECWRMPYRFPMVQRTRKQQTSSKLNNNLSLLRWHKQRHLQKQPANLRCLL